MSFPYRKYGAKRSESSDGRSFASKLERALYEELRLRELAGEIRNLKCQSQILLSKAQIIYKPDFQYEVVATGKMEWAESKGFETDVWRLKRRLWLSYGPGTLVVYKGSAARLKIHEVLHGDGSKEDCNVGYERPQATALEEIIE